MTISKAGTATEWQVPGHEREQRTFWSDAIHRLSRNKLAIVGCGLVVLLVFMAIFAPWITPQHYDEVHFKEAWLFPSVSHWMGTDGIGRDFYTRIVFGTRISLVVGLASQFVAFAIGIPLGLWAGLRGGKLDFVIMRFVDVMWAFPRILLAVLIMAVLGSGLKNVMLAIGLTSWVPLCRLSRAQILKEREQEYIVAAHTVGATDLHILLRHMFPNILPALIVGLTLGIPEAIFAEAGLSFLGLGVNPPIPSWGRMVGKSVNHIRHFWHLAFFPALMIAVTMLGFTLLGDGLRDALDVQMTK